MPKGQKRDLIGFERLYRDANAARAELAACKFQDAAVEEAVALLEDIAIAAWEARNSGARLTKPEQQRRDAESNSGG